MSCGSCNLVTYVTRRIAKVIVRVVCHVGSCLTADVTSLISAGIIVRMLTCRKVSCVVTAITSRISCGRVVVRCHALLCITYATLIPVICVVLAPGRTVSVAYRPCRAAGVTSRITVIVVCMSRRSRVSAGVTACITVISPYVSRAIGLSTADDTREPVVICIGRVGYAVAVSCGSRVSAGITRIVTGVGPCVRCLVSLGTAR